MKTQPAPDFVRWLKDIMDESPDSKFVWFLGAGCSISSGIKSAEGLTRDWLTKLRANENAEKEPLEEWTKRHYPSFNGSYGSLYGEAMRDLYPTEKLRQDAVERLTSNRQPGFGYAVLAQLLSQPKYGAQANVVLTTNFDDLVADALYLYSGQRPRVFAHESLIKFVRTTSSRPLVIKLHGDSHIGAKNTEKELDTLAESVKKLLGQLLHERSLIFIGYGGHDKSITDALLALPEEALPYGVYWVRSSVPETDLGKWLEDRKATHVELTDFDEFMLYLRQAFDLDHPSEKPFQILMQNYHERFIELRDRAASPSAPPEMRAALASAVQSAVSKAKDWWAVELETRKYTDSDPGKAEQVYVKGIERFPNSPQLLGSYAVFLAKQNRPNEAEVLYKRALEADPNYALALGNYSFFLAEQNRSDEAEAHYKRALEADPNHASNLCNYAIFLHRQHRPDEAEAHYKRALEAEPNHAASLGNYANLLSEQNRPNEAEVLYKRALEAEPNHTNNLGNFAEFLLLQERQEGLELLQRAEQAWEAATTEKGPLLGVLFNRLVFGPDDAARGLALERLCALLGTGLRSKKWSFAAVLTYAQGKGLANLDQLRLLAEVINDRQPLTALHGLGLCDTAEAG